MHYYFLVGSNGLEGRQMTGKEGWYWYILGTISESARTD
jgi:hypothetical protein